MNVPPKPETDCGVTAMCVQPVPAHHDGTPLWAAELVMFAIVLAVVAAGYRVLISRR